MQACIEPLPHGNLDADRYGNVWTGQVHGVTALFLLATGRPLVRLLAYRGINLRRLPPFPTSSLAA